MLRFALLSVCFLVLVDSADAIDRTKPKDPTGVDLLKEKASPQLTERLAAETTWDFVNTPLSDTFDLVLKERGIEFKTKGLPEPKEQAKSKTYVITANYRGKSVEDYLRGVLTAAKCRCYADGDTLVIVPQESDSP